MRSQHHLFLICGWVLMINFCALSEVVLSTSLKEPIFQGTKCFPNSIYPDEICSVATKSCCCSSTCVMWEEGKLVLPKKKKSFQSISRPCRVNHFTKRPKAAVNAGWYRFFDDCEISLFNPIDTDTILQNHMLIFFGDSMLRQLFHRLVWHLRGLEEVVEHYYHGHAIYARNATHDRFVVGEQDVFGKQHYPLPKNPHAVIEHPTLLLIFIFEPVLRDTAAVKTILQPTYLPDYQKVLIAGVHFWLKDRTNDTFIFRAINETIATSKSPVLTHQPQQKGVIPIWFPSWSNQFVLRHTAFVNFAKKLGYYILPSIELANSNSFLPNKKDQQHYQCAYTSWLHEALTVDGYKTPPDADCRDLFNLNLIQMILNILLGEEKVSPFVVRTRKLLRHGDNVNDTLSLPM